MTELNPAIRQALQKRTSTPLRWVPVSIEAAAESPKVEKFRILFFIPSQNPRPDILGSIRKMAENLKDDTALWNIVLFPAEANSDLAQMNIWLGEEPLPESLSARQGPWMIWGPWESLQAPTPEARARKKNLWEALKTWHEQVMVRE